MKPTESQNPEESTTHGNSPTTGPRPPEIPSNVAELSYGKFVDLIRSLPRESALPLLREHWRIVTPKPISPVLLYGRLMPRAPVTGDELSEKQMEDLRRRAKERGIGYA